MPEEGSRGSISLHYSYRDYLILILARWTGARVERIYRLVAFACAVTSSVISFGRRSAGTSDKSPR